MADSDSELRNEVRGITGLNDATLDHDEMRQVVNRAKRHIRTRRSLDADVNWYVDQYREEALFWAACLFAKVASGELDSQDISVGAIDANTLLAKDNEQVTVWYRNMEQAIRSVNTGTAFGHRAVERRTYGTDDENDDSGGVNL